jgi:signal transduction histidine kinase
MKGLKEYAVFLRENFLQRLASEHLEGARKMELPLLKFLGQVPENVVYKMSEDGMLKFLNGIEKGTAVRDAEENIKKWDKGQVPEIPREALLPADLVKLYSLQHQLLLKYIPEYTTDLKEAFHILDEISAYYLEVEGKAFDVLFKIRQETEQKLEKTVKKLENTTSELKRSNAELSQFAYMASHDLQEPLRMVASYMQLLQKRYGEKLDPTAREFIEYAVDGTKRMKLLIDDLLEYSRIGTRGHEFEKTSISSVVTEVISNLHTLITETGARIEHAGLPEIHADRMQMIQLFQNLISNSLKFRSTAPPQIWIDYKRKKTEHMFSVRDNGIGISREYWNRIFVIFQRLHSREEYPGTGIGLAICKKIIERHEGRIWLESEPGKGSVFYFTVSKNLKQEKDKD